MIGAIAGDVVGSVHEFAPHKSTDFPLLHPRWTFTEDTVLTIATAHAILTGKPYGDVYLDFGRRYPRRGYELVPKVAARPEPDAVRKLRKRVGHAGQPRRPWLRHRR